MTLQLHTFALAVSLFFLVPVGQEVRTLEPSKVVEREIAGGESHTYQIQLAAGQFVRVVVEQKAIDVALKIAAPDGTQLIEANFGEAGELEPLSAEAAAGGANGDVEAEGLAVALLLVGIHTAGRVAISRHGYRIKSQGEVIECARGAGFCIGQKLNCDYRQVSKTLILAARKTPFMLCECGEFLDFMGEANLMVQ